MTLASALILSTQPPAGAGRAPTCHQTARTLLRTLHCVASVYAVTLGDLRGPRKTKDVADARDVAAYLLQTAHGLSGDQIGRLLGRRHRATAACAWATIARRLAAGDDETVTAMAGVRRLIAAQPRTTEQPERPQAAATPLDVYWRIAM